MKTKNTRKTKKKGLLVQADDLEVGQYYTVVGLKHRPNQHLPISGQAFKVTAINLPFLVGKMVSDQSQPVITFDVRYLNFMKIFPEYVQAQRPENVS
jgi:hypothetical protein